MNITFPSFGEEKYTSEIENSRSSVITIYDLDDDIFDAYCGLFEKEGFSKKEESKKKAWLYAAYSDGMDAIFINYFANIRQLTIVVEKECKYFSYSDNNGQKKVSPQITQIHLEDFGMSYVVRLSDGRFIVIDGGREFEVEADKLYEYMKSASPYDKPIVASWIFSHPHSDHFHCFITFSSKYANDVVVEKVLFNFPERDDTKHYPSLVIKDVRFEDSSPYTNIPRLFEGIERFGASIYTPHTGQIYQIGDAKCEILASIDDTIAISDNVNASSLMIRMELANQVILWATDASFSIASIPKKYADYLKADILQIPHHGFQSGDAASEIAGYKLIKPEVCFLPVSDYNAYTAFCTFRDGTRFLMRDAGIGELITGEETRTITLPYEPSAYGKKELERKYFAGLDNDGAYTWIYSGLSTGVKEDFEFTILNTTHLAADISIDLFFEDAQRCIRYIKANISSLCIKNINIADEKDVDGDALYFNWMSLKEKGIPENAMFAVRFISNVPIVVSNKLHRESYRSNVIR